MKKFASMAAILVCTTLMSSCTTSSREGIDAYTYKKTAVTGERTKVGQSSSSELDCKSDGIPVLHVLQKPIHGTLVIVHEPVYPDVSGDYAKCRIAKIQGVVGYYTSNPGYVGYDKLVIRAPYGFGKISDSTIEISVVN